MKFLRVSLSLLSLLIFGQAYALDFDKIFSDSTLRLDYIFGGKSGENPSYTVMLDGITRTSGWAGRRHNLSSLPLRGNGQIIMTDATTSDTIYMTSFSTLFQEWVTTPEAFERSRSFENSFLVPAPRSKANVEVILFGNDNKVMASMIHPVDPSDILIKDKSGLPSTPYRYIHQGGDSNDVIDVAIVAEGYTVDEMDKFYKDAEVAVSSMFEHEPFKSRKDDFNFVAIASPSVDSGVSVPRLGQWKNTAVGSNFSTFYSNRYLTTKCVKDIHEWLLNIPYEHLIILANTTEYGGGGIYNFYTLTTAGHKDFRPVVVHEFGHSFGGLADEYFYENDDDNSELRYFPDVEPWEQNATTLADFSSKWQDMIAPGTPIPTPDTEAEKYPIGAFEGGANQTKGVYRPVEDCRMRTNTAPAFCPVCQRAINRVIDFYIANPGQK